MFQQKWHQQYIYAALTLFLMIVDSLQEQIQIQSSLKVYFSERAAGSSTRVHLHEEKVVLKNLE